MYGTPKDQGSISTSGSDSSSTKEMNGEVDSGFGNFHANLMNKGKDDKSPTDLKMGKQARFLAMKRRMSKSM